VEPPWPPPVVEPPWPPPVVEPPWPPPVVEPPWPPPVVEPPEPESLPTTPLLPQAARPADRSKSASGRSAADMFFEDPFIGNLLPARRKSALG
jgi:hypothetical protein